MEFGGKTKVLWLCNIKLPIISELQNIPSSPYGGWLDRVSKDLIKVGHDLCIVYPSGTYEEGQVDNLSYYGFGNSNTGKIFIDILHKVNPDVIHIWGTEYKHSYIMTECLKECGIIDRGIISIQGLVSVIAEHYFVKLPWRVIHGFTFRDLIKKDNVFGAMKTFRKRGKYEVKAIQNVKHIVGRTDWDKACTQIINPEACYHHCDETLRESFYKATWSIGKCERYSIFVSQASYPVKGFHILLEALPEIIKKHPDTIVYVAGHDPTYSNASWKDKLRRTYYGKYLIEMITKNDLHYKVIFTGPLNETQMRDRYLKSHVFVSCSMIENESNSISEAKLLGVPVVASYVGGVTSRVKHGVDGLTYQHDAPYMLAYYVNKIFDDDGLAIKIGGEARDYAIQTHDADININQMMNLYTKVATGEQL